MKGAFTIALGLNFLQSVLLETASEAAARALVACHRGEALGIWEICRKSSKAGLNPIKVMADLEYVGR